MQYRIHFNRPDGGYAKHYYIKARSPEHALTRFLTERPSADVEKVERLERGRVGASPSGWTRAPFFG